MIESIEKIVTEREDAAAAAWNSLRAAMNGAAHTESDISGWIATLGLAPDDLVEMAAAANLALAGGGSDAETDTARLDATQEAISMGRFEAQTESLVASLRATRAAEAGRRYEAFRVANDAAFAAAARHERREQIEAEHPYVFNEAFPPPITRLNRQWYAEESSRLESGRPIDLPAGMSLAAYRRRVLTVAARLAKPSSL